MLTVYGQADLPLVAATITINNNQTINLTSATGSNSQTVCTGSTITSVTYAIGGGGTGASITAGSLPTGVTGSYSAGVFTISGSPSVAGTFNYTITTSGLCTATTASGSLTVNQPSVSSGPTGATATPSAVLCPGDPCTLSAAGAPGTGAIVSWYTGSCGGTPVATGASPVVNPTATTTYYVRYEDPAPCGGSTLCKTVTVTVNSAATKYCTSRICRQCTNSRTCMYRCRLDILC